MGGESFLPDFARTINTADKVQPALLAVTLAATILLASSADGAERVLALAAVTGFAFVMIASLIFLVPLQRRMIKTGGDSAASLDAMKSKWSRGHIGRTVLAIVSFALLVLAVVL
jgi:anthrone oxygenase-like protein